MDSVWRQVKNYLEGESDKTLLQSIDVSFDSPLNDTDVRKKCKPIGRIVADAMRWHASRFLDSNMYKNSNFYKRKVDFAFINSGAIRKGLPQKKIRKGDILSIFFDNQIMVFEIRSKDLFRIFSIMGEQLYPYNQPEHNGSFLQVSGIELLLQESKADGNFGVEKLKIGSKELKKESKDLFVGVTNEYLLTGNVHGYSPMQTVHESKKHFLIQNEYIYDIFEEYITSEDFFLPEDQRILIETD